MRTQSLESVQNNEIIPKLEKFEPKAVKFPNEVIQSQIDKIGERKIDYKEKLDDGYECKMFSVNSKGFVGILCFPKEIEPHGDVILLLFNPIGELVGQAEFQLIWHAMGISDDRL